jgi:hypothetical protein
MYILNNDQLEIHIIDPIKDKKLLGARYCTGGYINQVKDLKKGNLFSGPEYPNPRFDVFNGQGAPEVFVTALNQDQCEVGEDVYVIGVGAVTRTSVNCPFHVRDNPNVKKFCKWEIEKKTGSIEMTSMCVFNQWNFIVTREITLNYRAVSSQTKIKNIGKEKLRILWFAHPFFPIEKNRTTCKFTPQVQLSENDGYFINNQGFIELLKDYNWKKGLYQKIEYSSKENLSVIQFHPLLGNLSINCDFIPESIAIWANDITFSFEPFYKAGIESGGQGTWNITYCF